MKLNKKWLKITLFTAAALSDRSANKIFNLPSKRGLWQPFLCDSDSRAVDYHGPRIYEGDDDSAKEQFYLPFWIVQIRPREPAVQV